MVLPTPMRNTSVKVRMTMVAGVSSTLTMSPAISRTLAAPLAFASRTLASMTIGFSSPAIRRMTITLSATGSVPLAGQRQGIEHVHVLVRRELDLARLAHQTHHVDRLGHLLHHVDHVAVTQDVGRLAFGSRLRQIDADDSAACVADGSGRLVGR